MADENKQNQGLLEAHTPGEFSESGEVSPDRAAKIGATAAATEAAMNDLVRQLAGAGDAVPDQQSLLLDEIDEQQVLFAGPVRHVAETIAAARNGRGRPKGSQNKASRQFAETLMRMGYRHPGLNLAALANADPLALAIELACVPDIEGASPSLRMAAALQAGMLKRDQVIHLMTTAQKLIKEANAELMPYFESKRPQQIELREPQLGIMVIGDMKADAPEATAVMDLTRFDNPE